MLTEWLHLFSQRCIRVYSWLYIKVFMQQYLVLSPVFPNLFNVAQVTNIKNLGKAGDEANNIHE